MSGGMSGTSHAARTPHALESEQVRWNLAPAPWSHSSPLIALAVELLPTIDDGLVVDLIERLALAVIDHNEELTAVRSVLSVALNLLHSERATNERLRAELYRLRDEYRGLRATRSQEATLAVPNSVRTSTLCTS